MLSKIAGLDIPASDKFSWINSKKRFSSKKHFPSKDDREHFLKMFVPNSYDYIYKPLSDSGTWKTAQGPNGEHWQLSHSEVFKAIACLHDKFYFGVRASLYTSFALFDIDKNSRYHNKAALAKIYEVLADAGIHDSALYRSSDSGGWHLYVFFETPVRTNELRTALVRLLSACGFVVESGHLEIFPNPGINGTQGHGVRLPLQPGFAWLYPHSAEVQCERYELSPAQALKSFLRDASCAHSFEEYLFLLDYVSKLPATPLPKSTNVVPIHNQKRITPVISSDADIKAVTEIFGFLPPGILPARYLQGRNFAISGLTGPSQRHEAGLALSHYSFYGDPERAMPALGYNHSEERFLFVWQILSTKHNGWSRALERQTQEAIKDVRSQANWVPISKRYGKSHSLVKAFDQATLLRNDRANKKSSRNARTKIATAAQSLFERGEQISVRAVAKEAGVCQNTALKHDDLWKPLKDEQFASFASASREYRPCDGESVVSSQVLEIGVQSTPAPCGSLEIFNSVCPESSWKKAILPILPSDLKVVETVNLQFLEAFLSLQLVLSPDSLSRVCLENIVFAIHVELSARWVVPDSVSLVQEEVKGSRYRNFLDTG